MAIADATAAPTMTPPAQKSDEPLGAPAHRIMVYAKASSRRVRFISDMAACDGALVNVITLGSAQEVEAFNRGLAQILQSDELAADHDGWHKVAGDLPLPEFLNRLFDAVRKAAWAEAFSAALSAVVSSPAASVAVPDPTPLRQNWDRSRIAWLGFLVGRGKSAKAIADDPLIRSTPGNVFRQVCRFGLSLSAVPHGDVTFSLPSWAITKLDRHADIAHLQRDAFVQRLVLNALRDGYGLAPRHYRADA